MSIKNFDWAYSSIFAAIYYMGLNPGQVVMTSNSCQIGGGLGIQRGFNHKCQRCCKYYYVMINAPNEVSLL